MRYKELQAAREQLIRVAKYLQGSRPILTGVERRDYVASLEVLACAVAEVREELKHPERFNLDGSRRVVKERLP